VRSTIEAIERDLTEDGFVLRYRATDAHEVDGLSGHEGAFLACSFWLADCLHLLGRQDDSRALLNRLIGLSNEIGLLAEEYDALAKRMVGNFPQAFSHVSLVNAAYNLSGHPEADEAATRLPSMPGFGRPNLRQWRYGRDSDRHKLSAARPRTSTGWRRTQKPGASPKKAKRGEAQS
jgi:hypothetical protein